MKPDDSHRQTILLNACALLHNLFSFGMIARKEMVSNAIY